VEHKTVIMCLYPTLIKNPKYKENKKNGGQVPPVTDKRVMYVPIGCGNCMECKKKKANEWVTRLQEECKSAKNGVFTTLTFSNESYKKLAAECKHTGYELDNEIAALAIRNFTNRWRKKYKKTFRYFFVTELGHGETEHLHIHGIIWTNVEMPLVEKMNEIERVWSYGYIHKWKEYRGKKINYVNGATANYMIKYMMKQDPLHLEYKQKILCSNGIGKNYTKTYAAKFNHFNDKETRDYYLTESGKKSSLPIYYRNKIYTEEEREKIWLNKLDKQERYVLGQKIAAENIEQYIKIRQVARQRNAMLGYKNYKNENRLEYEQKLREINQMKRIENKNKSNKYWMNLNKALNEGYQYSLKCLNEINEIKEQRKRIGFRTE
jgi:hypothetical protein